MKSEWKENEKGNTLFEFLSFFLLMKMNDFFFFFCNACEKFIRRFPRVLNRPPLPRAEMAFDVPLFFNNNPALPTLESNISRIIKD